MRSILILLGMVVCLFVPPAVFAYVGYKAVESLSKRPTAGAGVMIALVTKCVATAAVLLGLLMVLLKVYA